MWLGFVASDGRTVLCEAGVTWDQSVLSLWSNAHLQSTHNFGQLSRPLQPIQPRSSAHIRSGSRINVPPIGCAVFENFFANSEADQLELRDPIAYPTTNDMSGFRGTPRGGRGGFGGGSRGGFGGGSRGGSWLVRCSYPSTKLTFFQDAVDLAEPLHSAPRPGLRYAQYSGDSRAVLMNY